MRGTAIVLAVTLTVPLFTACGGAATPTPDSEREAIISFTRQALEIEAKRNGLMAYFAAMEGPTLRSLIAERHFLSGVPTGRYVDPYDPPTDLDGMSSLLASLLLLDSPQPLQAVKDALVRIYETEIQQAELEGLLRAEWDSGGRTDRMPRAIYPGVTKNNLEDWKQKAQQDAFYTDRVLGAWGRTQLLRQQVYTRWGEILQEHSIDPAEENFVAAPAGGDETTAYPPGSVPWIEERDGPLASYRAGLGLYGRTSRTTPEMWQERAYEPLNRLFDLESLLAAADVGGYQMPDRYFGQWAPQYANPTDLYARANRMLRTAFAMTRGERETYGLHYGGGNIPILLRYGLVLPRGAMDLIIGRLPAEHAAYVAEAGRETGFLDYLKERFDLGRYITPVPRAE